MSQYRIIPCILLLLSTTGCLYEIRDEIIDCEFQLKNCFMAESAWKQCSSIYQGIENQRDFRAGFKAGYKAVALGANGCPPTLPPACYWKACHATDAGKARAHAWFDGYAHGAAAADGDGVANSNRITTRGGNHALGSMTEMQHGDVQQSDAMPLQLDAPTPYSGPLLPTPTPAPAN